MTRRKSKGFAPHGKYAQIPVALSKEVLAVLTAPEFRVWFALCMQNQHWSNGTGKLCRKVIREFHLGSQRAVTAATKKLIEGKFIVRTRTARQRVCALYGVTHLPLNTDALAKAGVTESQIQTILRQFGTIVCDTNRGSANSATKVESLNRKDDISGSAKPPERPLALPPGNHNEHFSPPLVLPRWNTSKKSPCPIGRDGVLSSSDSGSESPSSSAGGPIKNIRGLA